VLIEQLAMERVRLLFTFLFGHISAGVRCDLFKCKCNGWGKSEREGWTWRGLEDLNIIRGLELE
jgi:hypothetical protein